MLLSEKYLCSQVHLACDSGVELTSGLLNALLSIYIIEYIYIYT